MAREQDHEWLDSSQTALGPAVQSNSSGYHSDRASPPPCAHIEPGLLRQTTRSNESRDTNSCK